MHSITGVDEADWEKLGADQLEQINNALTAERQEIIAKQKRLAPIWELKMREERALRNQVAQLNGSVPADQVVAPPSIESEEKFGEM